MHRGVFFFFVCILLASFARAESNEYPQAMAVLGDSLSEGILANYSYEVGLPTQELFRMLGFAAIREREKRVEAFRKHYAARDKSWAGGTNEESLVYSHYRRLKNVAPDLIVENFAVAGSESYQLAPQVDALLQYEEEEGVSFDYITLMIGGNDLKQDKLEHIPSALVFVGNVESQLVRLLETRQSARILLVGLPHIFDIFESTKDLVVARVFNRSLTCGYLRSTIYHDSVLFQTENRELNKIMRNIFDQYHAGLERLADRLNEYYPEAEVKLAHSYVTMQNVAKGLSVDCFHPSEWGQAEIAESSWSLGFWPNLEAKPSASKLAKLDLNP